MLPGAAVLLCAGRVEETAGRLGLFAERWATAVDGKVTYQRDVRIDAELNEAMLRVPGVPPLRLRRGRF